MLKRMFPGLVIVTFTLSAFCSPCWSAPVEVSTPMPPPEWALLERELLRANTDACLEFFDRYFDERGYLLCVERWGGDDGPDDAIENVADWPILHMLGAPDVILHRYKKAWEGHLRQYTQAKTVEVPFARDGMYYKEFPTMMDWMHNGEGLRVFNLQGLSDPSDRLLEHRTRRFAGFYMNEDPQAPNYDPKHKIIKSLFNGSRGPLMRKATALDWAGDPIEVEHRFKLGHGERSYQEMLDHFKDYNDIIGDHPQNLSATTLALNAYMLTGEEKYKRWLLEYADAWVERTKANDGIIPSNIGLDGAIGGATNGKWYGGVYGWGFTVVVPQTGALAHRINVPRALIGFGNAFLLTGDRTYIDLWTAMIDKINAQAKIVEGKTVYPRMFGDQGWYAHEPTKYDFGAFECAFWTCEDKNLARVAGDPWIAYLSGKDPGYPQQALRGDFAAIRRAVEAMRNDPTTPDTRLADDPMEFNPATVQTLLKLMCGGLDPGRGAGPLHCRLRYFDPTHRRAGLPEDVAALITSFDAETVQLTLVNVNQLAARDVIVQGGAYAEHQCVSVNVLGKESKVDQPSFKVRLAPGAGTTMTIKQRRYANRPTLSFPWEQ